MDKIGICAVLVFVLTGYVAADNDDNLTCCPPSYYLLNKECWDPATNVTKSIRPVCDDTIKIKKFVVKNGKVEIKISELYTERFDSSL